MSSVVSRRLSVAPMLDWTDRHYRFFARQITHHALLYSEMVTTGALLFGQADRFLSFDEAEHPVALQLGGSDPKDLAKCAILAQTYGYDEVNLNCGCPSPRVQKGAFGACLMNEVSLVADCLKAMQDVTDIDVTVKHRIGVDREDSYDIVRDFVGALAHQTSCSTFIVHARNAWLEGLSPKENREVPPLKYEYVYKLKQDFPDLEIIINGGVKTNEDITKHLDFVDGVMVGREAYHNPYFMAQWDQLFYDDSHAVLTQVQIVDLLRIYCQKQLDRNQGTNMRHMVRHYLGLMQGKKGAKAWRRMLSDAKLLNGADTTLLVEAVGCIEN
ncbi:tRNA dihydrouridine(20/20a) synthase DusA [Neisseria sp. Ec49-e6-T10]|uniref:tRNA dihydrouridine(20/20a) synthase DusA n=1 Tax=Neisseria sp. Ec49-e6-T10 TaxID=3140744 RepID=UPI003EB6AE9F